MEVGEILKELEKDTAVLIDKTDASHGALLYCMLNEFEKSNMNLEELKANLLFVSHELMSKHPEEARLVISEMEKSFNQSRKTNASD